MKKINISWIVAGAVAGAGSFLLLQRILNGIEYQLERQDNKYTATLPVAIVGAIVGAGTSALWQGNYTISDEVSVFTGPPNDADPFLGALPANTKFVCHVAAFSTRPQRVTVIVPGIGEHTFEGQSTTDANPWGHTTKIGGEFRFRTGAVQVKSECWNEQKFGQTWYNYEFYKWEGDSDSYILPFSMRGIGTLLYFAVDPIPDPPPQPQPQPSPNELAILRQHIIWMWNERGTCIKPKCVFYVVEAKFGVQFQNGSFGPIFPYTFRGLKSAHDCVKTAKEELNNGSRGMAIAWLQAGQLHNEEAQRLISKHADAALEIIAGL
jgi:hypothetical protein